MGKRTAKFVVGTLALGAAIAIAAAWQGQQTSSQSSQTSQQSSTQSSQSGSGRATATASSSGSARSSGSQSGFLTGRQGASGSGGGFAVSAPPPTHAVIFTEGSSWVEGKSWRAQPGFAEHSAYMQRLLMAGKVVYGGPWRDEPGALTILRAASDEEARQIVDADPFVQNGVLVPDLKAWTVVFDGVSIGRTRHGGQ